MFVPLYRAYKDVYDISPLKQERLNDTGVSLLQICRDIGEDRTTSKVLKILKLHASLYLGCAKIMTFSTFRSPKASATKSIAITVVYIIAWHI